MTMHNLEKRLFDIISESKANKEQRLNDAKGVIATLLAKQKELTALAAQTLIPLSDLAIPSLDAKNHANETLLSTAIDHFPELVPDLLDAGVRCSDPSTFSSAIRTENFSIIATLLERGVDVPQPESLRQLLIDNDSQPDDQIKKCLMLLADRRGGKFYDDVFLMRGRKKELLQPEKAFDDYVYYNRLHPDYKTFLPIAKIETRLKKYPEAIRHCEIFTKDALLQKNDKEVCEALAELKTLHAVKENKKFVEEIAETVFKKTDRESKQYVDVLEHVYPITTLEVKREIDLEKIKKKVSELLVNQDEAGLVKLIKLTEESKDANQRRELEKGLKLWARSYAKEFEKMSGDSASHRRNIIALLLKKEYEQREFSARIVEQELIDIFDAKNPGISEKIGAYHFHVSMDAGLQQLKYFRWQFGSQDAQTERAVHEYKALLLHLAINRDEKFFMRDLTAYLESGLTPLTRSTATTALLAEKKQDLSKIDATTIQLARDEYPPAIYALANHHKRNNNHHYALINYADFFLLLSALDNKKAALACGVTEQEIERQRKVALDYISEQVKSKNTKDRQFAMWLLQFINEVKPAGHLMERWVGGSVHEQMVSVFEGRTLFSNSSLFAKFPELPASSLSKEQLKEYYMTERVVEAAKKKIPELLAKQDETGIEELIKLADESKDENLTRELERGIKQWARDFCEEYLNIHDNLLPSGTQIKKIRLLNIKEYNEKSVYAKFVNCEIAAILDMQKPTTEFKTFSHNFYAFKCQVLGEISQYKESQEREFVRYKCLINMPYFDEYSNADDAKKCMTPLLRNSEKRLHDSNTHLNKSAAITYLAADKKQDLSTKNATTIQFARDNYPPAILALAKYHKGKNHPRRALVQYANFLVLLAGLDNKKAAAAFRVTEEEIEKQRNEANDYIQLLMNDKKFEHRAFAQWLFHFIKDVIVPGKFNLMENLTKISVHDFMLSVFARWDAIQVCVGDKFPASSLTKDQLKEHYRTGLDQVFYETKRWRLALALKERVPEPKADVNEKVFQLFVEEQSKKVALAKEAVLADQKFAATLEQKEQLQQPAVAMMSAQPLVQHEQVNVVVVQVVVPQVVVVTCANEKDEKKSEPTLYYGEQPVEKFPVKIVGSSYVQIKEAIKTSAPPASQLPESAPMYLCGAATKKVVTQAVVEVDDEKEAAAMRELMGTMQLPDALFNKKVVPEVVAPAPQTIVAPVRLTSARVPIEI